MLAQVDRSGHKLTVNYVPEMPDLVPLANRIGALNCGFSASSGGMVVLVDEAAEGQFAFNPSFVEADDGGYRRRGGVPGSGPAGRPNCRPGSRSCRRHAVSWSHARRRSARTGG